MARTQSDPLRAGTSFGFSLWLAACGFNAAVGTCFIGDRYYVLPGLSWLDVLLCVAALRVAIGKRISLAVSPMMSWHVLTTLGLSFWLMLSTAVNALRFETHFSDVMPAIKLIYLSLVVVMIRRYTVLHGVRWLLIGCFAGVLTVTLQDLAASERLVGGLPLLLNPNVTGALLGLGVWFAVFGLLVTTSFAANAVVAMILAALSITSFSKGAWLMCGLGLIAGLVVALSRKKLQLPPRYRKLGAIVVVAVLVQSAILVRSNIVLLTDLVSLKMTTTVAEGGSVDLRSKFVQASVRAGLDYPVFGLGYRNFYQTQTLYPDLRLPPLERLDNAHNLFAQTLAVAGIPGAVLLAVVFTMPFVVLWRKLKGRIPSVPLRAVIWALSFSVWFLYASVQLQLIANPPFWLFCGLVFGIPREPLLPGRQPV